MNKLFNKNDKIGLIACSNGYPMDKKYIILELVKTLESFGLQIEQSNYLYNNYNIIENADNEKAKIVNRFFIDKDIKAIFDISGGDLSNGILPFLDFNTIKKNPKPFFGYSDLSVILNSLYRVSSIETYHYQIRNLVGDEHKTQLNNFLNTFFYGQDDLLKFNYKFVQGNFMEGVVVGGNLRCTLKLAGTNYMPDFTDKLLFIESLGGNTDKIATYLNQYNQIGAFDKLNGIILGTFTEAEKNNLSPKVEEILLSILKNTIPIIKTKELGHNDNSKCIIIGKKYTFK